MGRVIADETPAFGRLRCHFRSGIKAEPHDSDPANEQVGILRAGHADRDIRFAAVQRQISSGPMKRHGDPGVSLVESHHVWGNKSRGDRGRCADPDRCRRCRCRTLCITADRLDRVLHSGDQLGDSPAIRRQRRTARQAVDEAQVECLLQRRNAAADGRVVDAKFPRCRGQRAGARQRGQMNKVLPIDHQCIIAQVR